MSGLLPANVVDRPTFRDRIEVFRDRAHAGEVLSSMLGSYINRDTVVLAIPAGGVPVGAIVAEQLDLLLDVAVVSKVTLPWNTEAGYGAVAFDGTVRLNESLLPHLGLTEREMQKGIDQTYQKVIRRQKLFRGDRPFPDLSELTSILIDDGLASGFTMLVGVEALRKVGANEITVAVPTGHLQAVQRMAGQVETVYCANIRGGLTFAVADAYQRWSDIREDEAVSIYKRSIARRS